MSKPLVNIFGKPITAKMVRNPMLDYPKQAACWCGSNKKAKVCCIPKMSKVIPEFDAEFGIGFVKFAKEQLAKGWRPTKGDPHAAGQAPGQADGTAKWRETVN
jgi:hypothetical protein